MNDNTKNNQHKEKKSHFHLVTFGCQMNEHDSEMVAGVLESAGYDKTDNPSEAELFIFNTCAVRESAENRVLGRLGDLKKYKMENKEVIVAVCGCMIQQETAVEQIFKRAPFVDIIFSSHNASQLPALIAQVKAGVSPVQAVSENENIEEGLKVKREGKLKAYVTIMYGCDNFCSYCIVPYVRGREKSREPEAILQEVADLVQEGCKEIMFLGQNVNSYGKTLFANYDFADLLRDAAGIRGVERIRYMTSHPRDISDKIIKVIAEHQNICEHFHLPIQAGSDRILKAMNRGYTQSEYLDLIVRIRAAIPEAAITTDIIVGFPGETEEDFLDTLVVMEKVRFDAAYTFIYSKRSGTVANDMTDHVPLLERKNRLKRLMALQTEIGFEINQKLVDKIFSVLVEGVSKSNSDMLSGKTTSNKSIIFHGTSDLIGEIIPVKIESAQTWTILGKVQKGGEI
jgi:tRNA-2-methylthio-N6-dimethylallyladenosine synthase